MDGSRFDELAKGLATGLPRRKVVKGLAGGVAAGVAVLFGRSGADARRVTQAYCGNEVCIDDPSVCNDECVCCVWGNGNSRCMPPRDCQRAGGEPGGGTSGGSTCSGGVIPCGEEELLDCGPAENECSCVLTVTGESFCSNSPVCESSCDSDDECMTAYGSGFRCVTNGGGCCESETGNVCGSPCGAELPS